MDDSSPQWLAMGQPASDAERQALRALKSLLADSPTTWAWSNVMFFSPDGRAAEADVILVNRNGLFVLELKGWHGRITGDQQRWRQLKPGGGVLVQNSPAGSTRFKAQLLKSLLESKASGRQGADLPFVESAVVMHGRDSRIDLPEDARANVYGLDGYDVAGVPPLSRLLRAEPTRLHNKIDKGRAQVLVALMGQAGFTARPKIIMVGQYALSNDDPLTDGAGWQDRRAAHPMLHDEFRRLRLFDVAPDASPAQRAVVQQTARREYLLTHGLQHPGVVAPLEILDTERGPALVFPDDAGAVPLPVHLADQRDTLDLGKRTELIRQIAEIIAYAHRNRVHHRGLTPAQVWVRAGEPARVTVRDWQTGMQSGEQTVNTTLQSVLAGATDVAAMVAQDDMLYLAPESLSLAVASPDPVALDVYGLGALAHLILTDAPPAPTFAELQQRLAAGGLDPSVLRDGIPAPLADLVAAATDPDPAKRLADPEAFLAGLDAAGRDSAAAEEPEQVMDPLEAQPGDLLGDALIVEERLGSGATGLALLVSAGSADSVPTVLKVAHDDARAGRLRAEADVLARLDHPRIVQLLHGPFELGGRTVIEVADAGRPTLGKRIRDEGRLTVEQLHKYGRDLFEAAAYLESAGVMHRDIKPENLGVRADRSDRRPRLVLFDFSLANEPADHVHAGTGGYIDPFVGGRARPRYDSAAERFAVAATLFHMATGNLPEWGDGGAAPAAIADEVTLEAAWFEDQVAAALISFFRTALARESTDRFDDLASMARAWDGIFTSLDARAGSGAVAEGGDAARDTAAAAATDTTPLASAGLTARARSALARLGVATVAEVLALPAVEINQMPGVGVAVRREIQRRRSEWRQRLRADTHTPAELLDPLGIAVEATARSLIPQANGKNDDAVALATALLQPGGPGGWPTWEELARRAGLDPAAVGAARTQLVALWRRSDRVDQLRRELMADLEQRDIITAAEAAVRLASLRGSRADGDQRIANTLPLLRVAVEADAADTGDVTVSRGRAAADPVLLAATGDTDPAPRLAAVRRLAGTVADAVAADRAPLRPIRSLALVTDTVDADTAAVPDPSRLLSLAAAAGSAAAVSSRGELYARGQEPAITLAAVVASRLGHTVVSAEWLRRTAAARFPAAAPLPPRPTLDALVAAASPDLVWDGRHYVRTGTHTGSLLATGTRLVTGEPGGDYDAVHERLAASLADRSALVLGVDPRHLTTAPTVLADRYGVTAVDVTAELLASMRSLAQRNNIGWQFLLDVDAADPGSPDRDRLTRFTKAALDEFWPELLDRAEPLLLTGLAPLARYGHLGLLDPLVTQSAHRPAARWILVPHRVVDGPPTLEHQPVPLPAGTWTDLPTALVTRPAAGKSA